MHVLPLLAMLVTVTPFKQKLTELTSMLATSPGSPKLGEPATQRR